MKTRSKMGMPHSFSVVREQQDRGEVWEAGIVLIPKGSTPVPWKRKQNRSGVPRLSQTPGSSRHTTPLQYRHPSLGMAQRFDAAPKSVAEALSKSPQSSSSLSFLFSQISYPRFILSELILNTCSKF